MCHDGCNAVHFFQVYETIGVQLRWRNPKYIYKSVPWNIDEFQKWFFLLSRVPSGEGNHSGAVLLNANDQSVTCWGISHADTVIIQQLSITGLDRTAAVQLSIHTASQYHLLGWHFHFLIKKNNNNAAHKQYTACTHLYRPSPSQCGASCHPCISMLGANKAVRGHSGSVYLPRL